MKAISIMSPIRPLARARVEALTADLCEAAWEEFQTIEAEGGVLASLAARAYPEARQRGSRRAATPPTGRANGRSSARHSIR